MASSKAYKPKRTLKPPAIQSAILAKRANGASKASIAKELSMSVNTVTSVLELNDFDRNLQSEQRESLRLIPAARKAVMHRLALNDGNIGVKVLENTIWPLNEKQGKTSGDPSLVLAIQNLMGNVTVSAPSEIASKTQAISDARETPQTIDCQSAATPSSAKEAIGSRSTSDCTEPERSEINSPTDS